MVVSNHAMEHVEEPAKAFREFYRILKPGGKVIIVTPYDSVSKKFSENDPDFHLFSWNPATAGNLAKACGSYIIAAEEIVHRWPPKWEVIWRRLGAGAFHMLSKLYGYARRNGTQVRLGSREAASIGLLRRVCQTNGIGQHMYSSIRWPPAPDLHPGNIGASCAIDRLRQPQTRRQSGQQAPN